MNKKFHRKASFVKRPLQSGIYLLKRDADSDLEIVFVFFVDVRKSNGGGWYYSDYPHARVTEPIDESCKTYKWSYIQD